MKVLVGLVLGAAIGVAVGYALFNAEAETPAEVDQDRGQWPDVFCPPQQTAEPKITVAQRLMEIFSKGPPPEVVPVLMDCWNMPPPPDQKEMRVMQVLNAWNMSNAAPNDWSAIAEELEPLR